MAAIQVRRNGTLAFIYWIWDSLDRTIFTAIKFSFPARFVSPFGFLGMLTFITFIHLGISGALLMFYYEPIITRSWDSVQFINDTVPFGFHIRNVHYHGSNAMVLLAILHMYYQFFSGRYRIRNEVLWVTGILLGSITVLEAFTGYNLIMNERAVLAINIGASLNNAAPIVGPLAKQLLFGAGLTEVVLRMYSFHVFIVPIVMVILMFFHFPRTLVWDIPMSAAICGSILLVGGLYPVELGLPFDPNIPPGITVPEWYLTALYAFLRTGAEKFTVGLVLPTIFILAGMFIIFIDNSKRFTWRERPLLTAIGVTTIVQGYLTSFWGFYVNPDSSIDLFTRLFIQPLPFYTAMLISVVVSFASVYGVINYLKKRDAARIASRSPRPKSMPMTTLKSNWLFITMAALIVFQIFLTALSIHAYSNGLNSLSLFELGLVMITFSVMTHLYRYGKNIISADLVKATPVSK